jgi:type I restriction enzyme, S subunit
MNAPWPDKKLCSIADIRVSNVDKKTHASETPVKLCNYLDVYSNESVTNELDFMEASASKAEIERFGLNLGDVVITKDSESPDDIGIPAVIAEPIDHLVCGYHLALIRPRADQLDSVYLAKQLSTSRVARYFALHASGSTRYALPISVIESVSIPTPPKPEQTKIAEILSTVDRAIEQTETLITKQERIKTGLMQDLLTRGIDEHGNLRSEQTHQFQESPMGRIPVEWEVVKLSHFVARLAAGVSVNAEDTPCGSHQIGVLKTSALQKGKFISEQNKTIIKADENRAKVSPFAGTVLISRMNTPALVGESGYVDRDYPELFLPDRIWMTIFHERKATTAKWVSYVLTSPYARNYISLHATGTSGTMKNLPKASLLNMPLKSPKTLAEMKQIYEILQRHDDEVDRSCTYLAKLRSLKTALMQDLLTGRRRVTALLATEPKREKMYAQQ